MRMFSRAPFLSVSYAGIAFFVQPFTMQTKPEKSFIKSIFSSYTSSALRENLQYEHIKQHEKLYLNGLYFYK